jgi:hypothetical protein
MPVIRDGLFLSLFSSIVAAVTVIPTTFTVPRPYINTTKLTTSAESVAASILHTNDKVSLLVGRPQDIWKAGVGDIYASQDSFVRGFIDAGVQHQHLVLRAEDVWFTILTQLSFWLRKSERLEFTQANASRAYSWGELSFGMGNTMNAEFNLKDKTNSLGWSKANFTTSNWGDDITSTALLMFSSIATPKPESDDVDRLVEIGIPSITLSGVQKDWELLVQKLDRIERLGNQPATYSRRLRPILNRFVTTFQDPNSRDVRNFWDNAILQRSQSSQGLSRALTGWLNGFLYWDTTGRTLENISQSDTQMILDQIQLPWYRLQDLPSAYSSLRMCWISDRLDVLDIDLVAGMMAKSVRKGIPEGYEAAIREAGLALPSTVSRSDHSILRPLSLYFGHSHIKVVLTPAL